MKLKKLALLLLATVMLLCACADYSYVLPFHLWRSRTERQGV